MKSPAVIGAGGGTFGGAGIGLMTGSGKTPEQKLQDALKGARYGALIGGLGGGIISAGQLAKAVERAKAGGSGPMTELARFSGAKDAMNTVLEHGMVRPEKVNDVRELVGMFSKKISEIKPL